MISERSLRKVVEGAGYRIIDLVCGKHYKLTVANDKGRMAQISVSNSPRSQSHWPCFVLADIKRRMR